MQPGPRAHRHRPGYAFRGGALGPIICAKTKAYRPPGPVGFPLLGHSRCGQCLLRGPSGNQSSADQPFKHAQGAGAVAKLGGCGQSPQGRMWPQCAGRRCAGSSKLVEHPQCAMGDLPLYGQARPLPCFVSAPDGQGAALERGVVSIQKGCFAEQIHRWAYRQSGAGGHCDSTDIGNRGASDAEPWGDSGRCAGRAEASRAGAPFSARA